MPTVEKILTDRTIGLISDIRENMTTAGQNATGETANSLKFQIEQGDNKYKMTLFGRAFFMTVQTGRKPTPDKKPSREMIERITDWVQARGIDSSAVWAIATNIQKKGTKLWQSGGREDIVDPAVDDFINNVSQDLLQSGADDFVLAIKEMKW